MTVVIKEDRLQRRDYLLLATVCLLFFGHALVIGRVLSMHEGILPQTAREMFHDHDWMIPKNGGRPWLEKPPLPQWITVAVASLFGRCDAEWIVRIPPILMGTTSVLLVAWMGSLWFGRAIGYLSGLILATCWEFLRYSTYAEADIFLCALVTGTIALFVRQRIVEAGDERRWRLFGGRSLSVLAFFVLLGLTNLAKGPLFGAVVAIIPIAGLLLSNRDWTGLRRYAWVWGGVIFLAIASVWPIAAYLRHPDVLDLWLSDHLGRLKDGYIGAPVWYYAVNVWWLFLPWTPVVLLGLWLTARTAYGEQSSPQRFLWCWALLPPLVLSLPDGKHHHYLLHSMAPWAVLGALGAVRVWHWLSTWPAQLRQPLWGLAAWGAPGLALVLLFGDRLPGAKWLQPALYVAWPATVLALCWFALRRDGRQALAGSIGVVMVAYVAGLTYKAHWLDRCREDTEFLAAVQPIAGPDRPVYVCVDHGCLEAFRLQFYLGERAKVLHNLTYLRDESIRDGELLLLARLQQREQLAEYGETESILCSGRTRRESTPMDRWTLFRVRLRPDLERVPADVPMTQMQIADRSRGPFLGPTKNVTQ